MHFLPWLGRTFWEVLYWCLLLVVGLAARTENKWNMRNLFNEIQNKSPKSHRRVGELGSSRRCLCPSWGLSYAIILRVRPGQIDFWDFLAMREPWKSWSKMVKLDGNKRGCKLFRCQFKFHESTLFALSILWGVCWLYSWHDTCHGLVAGASSTWKEAHCDVWQVQDISRDSLDKGVYVWNMPLDCDETLPLSLVYSTQFPSEWEHKSRQEQSYSSKYLKDQNKAHWKSLKYIVKILKYILTICDILIEIEPPGSLDQRCAQRYHITLRGQPRLATPRRPILFLGAKFEILL